ncbi:MAG: hypothetical protein U0Q16_09610 [Bryobacteraceae bacterium]
MFRTARAIAFANLVITPVMADMVTVNFDNYSTGVIHNQNGWKSSGAAGGGCKVYDVAVVQNTYGFTAFGTKSLRISNAVVSGCFSDQTYSKPILEEAGEARAVNGGQSGGTRRRQFNAQWSVASTKATHQPGLAVDITADRGDGARGNLLRISDEACGIRVDLFEYRNRGFVFNNAASCLSRSSPHIIRLKYDFLEGPGNDVVQVYVNNTLRYTGTTWEDASANPPPTVDSLLFRPPSDNSMPQLPGAPATLGFGFLFDNITISNGGSVVDLPIGF